MEAEAEAKAAVDRVAKQQKGRTALRREGEEGKLGGGSW